MNADRRSYDTGASAETQSNINVVANRLESLIDARASDVGIALGDFDAQDVSSEYSTKEQKWGSAAHEVKSVIALLRKTMADNDGTAGDTMAKARSAVAAIG